LNLVVGKTTYELIHEKFFFKRDIDLAPGTLRDKVTEISFPVESGTECIDFFVTMLAHTLKFYDVHKIVPTFNSKGLYYL
jgi:hypothetical protein